MLCSMIVSVVWKLFCGIPLRIHWSVDKRYKGQLFCGIPLWIYMKGEVFASDLDNIDTVVFYTWESWDMYLYSNQYLIQLLVKHTFCMTFQGHKSNPPSWLL